MTAPTVKVRRDILEKPLRTFAEKGSDGVLVAEVDLRDPEAVIDGARGLIDFGEPVALLLVAVLHFLTDAEQPHKVVRTLTEALAPGSAVALSHVTDEAIGPEASLARPEGPVCPPRRSG